LIARIIGRANVADYGLTVGLGIGADPTFVGLPIQRIILKRPQLPIEIAHFGAVSIGIIAIGADLVERIGFR
jgi:hypothetical protein